MILLDTHVVIWLLTAPERISVAARQAIAEAGARGEMPGVSAASLFELAYAVRRGRLRITVPRAEFLSRLSACFEIRPVTGAIAIEAAMLEGAFHADPMDRMIVATAVAEDRTLLTADRKILDAAVCPVLW